MSEGAGWLAGTVAVIALIFIVVAGGAWLFSIKGTDPGEICMVREGGPFDGRDFKEVREPGSGPKPIGAWNHQECLPLTERDSNDVLEDDPSFPTKDSVAVIVDGQALFTLTADEKLITEFARKFGRRKWGGESIYDDEGWRNFLRERFQPVLFDTLRQTVGKYDCIQLNNLCQYIQNVEAVEKGEVKKVDNTQNLADAANEIEKNLTVALNEAFGGDYFEDVRYQNLRIRFEEGQETTIRAAQTKRTEVATARLEAQKALETARGERRVAREQNKAIREKARGYRLNPAQARIDLIEKLCGTEGCSQLQVLGGNALTVLGGKQTP